MGRSIMPTIDSRISLGNILTILAGIVVAIGWFASMQVANATRDEKVKFLETRVVKTESLSKDIQMIKVDLSRVQEKQDVMLDILKNRQ